MSSRVTLLQMLLQRRQVLVPLAAVLAVDVLVYALGVYPLAQRVANVEERDRTAEQTLAAARQDYDMAHGTLTGKQRAATELASFYKDVLPGDLAGARRLTHLRVAQLARQSGLSLERSSFDTIGERDSALTRAKSDKLLRGTYDAMRMFIYRLETAPEFVVIDDVGLAEGSDTAGELVLTLKLSTYFRASPR